MARRWLGRVSFWLALPWLFPVAAAAGAAWLAPLSAAGRMQAAGGLLLVLGLVTLPLRRSATRLPLSRLGISLLVAGLAWYAVSVQAAGTRVRLLDLAGGDPPPQLGSTREADLVVAGADVLTRAGRLRPSEAAGLSAALAAAYAELELQAGRAPAAFERQTLGRAGAGGEALVVTPASVDPGVAVLFLHGYGGNFVWPCWAVSLAAARINATTLCPSGPIDGRWHEGPGSERVAKSLAWLHARGVTRVYLAGLSAGAISATRLLRPLDRRFVGLVLLSGADARGRSGGLPTLAVQGSRDTMVSPQAVRRFARRHRGVRHVEVKGNHFVLLHRRHAVVRTVGAWLQAVERRAARTQRTQRIPTSPAR